MPKMIQLRNVPDDLHKVLKSRAALAGKSLSDYLIAEIQRHAEYPTVEELRRRLRACPSARLSVSPAQMIREERDSR
jgi:plasmid stability protein